MYVYLMQSVIRNIYKIGFSQSPEQRMRQINNDWNRGVGGNPPIHSVIWVCFDSHPQLLEADLHGHFYDQRILNIGEYFYFPEIDIALAEIEAKTTQPQLISNDRVLSNLELIDLNTFVNQYPLWSFRKFSLWFQTEFPEPVTVSDESWKAINNWRGLGDYVTFG